MLGLKLVGTTDYYHEVHINFNFKNMFTDESERLYSLFAGYIGKDLPVVLCTADCAKI